MRKQQEFYKNNKEYTKFLDNQSTDAFKKYASMVLMYLAKGEKFLDVGCGTGIALSLIEKKSKKIYGIDVSYSSIRKCKKIGLNARVYDGKKIPYTKNSFSVVGSFNVLEHTDNPELFLNEQYRVLKRGGHMLIICPNFLSITNNYHWHTSGLKNKVSNFITTIKKLFTKKYKFLKMQTVSREVFRADDDACIVTNPIDIIKWGQKKKMKLIHWSTKPIFHSSLFISLIELSPLKIFFGASFIILKK